MSIKCTNCSFDNPEKLDIRFCLGCGQELFEQCPVCNSLSLLGKQDFYHDIIRGSKYCSRTGWSIAEKIKEIEAALEIKITDEEEQARIRELINQKQKLLMAIEMASRKKQFLEARKKKFLLEIKCKRFKDRYSKYFRRRGKQVTAALATLCAILVILNYYFRFNLMSFKGFLENSPIWAVFISMFFMGRDRSRDFFSNIGFAIFQWKLWTEFNETYTDPPDEELEALGFKLEK